MDEIINQTSQKLQKVIQVVASDLATIRTGKASPQLIENLVVEAYGSKMKLLELATISAPDPLTLTVTPFDISNMNAIAKAIAEANLGLTAAPQDSFIRVAVPALSAERRQEYVKLAGTKIEGGKVMARQIRHEAMEDIAKAESDEDTKERMEKEIQKMIDQTVEKLELQLSEKEKELMAI